MVESKKWGRKAEARNQDIDQEPEHNPGAAQAESGRKLRLNKVCFEIGGFEEV